VDDKWYSSDNKSLPLINITTGYGTDQRLGAWNETCLNYDLVRDETHTKIIASIRQWHEFSAITFHLETGDQLLTNTIPLHMDQVRTIFPAFNIEQMNINDTRSYFTFEDSLVFNFHSFIIAKIKFSLLHFFYFFLSATFFKIRIFHC